MGRRKDGMPRHLPPFEPAGRTCYFANGVCPFHGVQHEFNQPTTKEEA